VIGVVVASAGGVNPTTELLFAAHPVAVAVEMAAVAGVAAPDGVGTGGSGRRAVLVGAAAGVVVLFLLVSFLFEAA
jgi:hypothetical protein